MKPSTPEERLRLTHWCAHAAGLAGALAVAGLAYALLVEPQRRAWRTIRHERIELETLVRRAAAIKREYAQLNQQRDHVANRIAAAAARIPAEAQEAEFLSRIKQTAAQCAASLDDYRPGVIAIQPPISRMEIGLTVSGSYASVCRFLERIRQLDRLNRVVQFEISAGKVGVECQARLTLWIYFDPAGANAEKGGNHA